MNREQPAKQRAFQARVTGSTPVRFTSNATVVKSADTPRSDRGAARHAGASPAGGTNSTWSESEVVELGHCECSVAGSSPAAPTDAIFRIVAQPGLEHVPRAHGIEGSNPSYPTNEAVKHIKMCIPLIRERQQVRILPRRPYAVVAQQRRHHVANVGIAGASPASRTNFAPADGRWTAF
jgi:hypothetical protein